MDSIRAAMQAEAHRLRAKALLDAQEAPEEAREPPAQPRADQGKEGHHSDGEGHGDGGELTDEPDLEPEAQRFFLDDGGVDADLSY